METIRFIEDHWALFTVILGGLISFVVYLINILNAVKCCLRNDILAIYDRCKEKQEISKYELSAIEATAKIYFLLKGNSFVHEIILEVREFKII